ncbi:MAG: NAD-dependent epimerase/dehydratase family protein [Sphingosinicella sp.]
MQDVLITGGTGLLGRHLLAELAKMRVHLLGRALEGRPKPDYECDLGAEVKFDWLPSKMDAVIYLAQSPRYRDLPDGALEVMRVNATQVGRLLEYARAAGVRSFIYASSGGVYGNSREPASENRPVQVVPGANVYVASKILGEAAVASYAGYFNTVILRPFFIYGRSQRREMLIPRLVDRIRARVPVVLSGRNGMKLNPIHASDAARATAAALHLEGGQIVNLAGPEVLTLRGLCEAIGEKLNVSPVFEIIEADGDVDLVGDISKMRTLLGQPSVAFSSGVVDVLD